MNNENFNLNINPNDYPTVKCECGCRTFTPAVIMKKVSGFAAGMGSGSHLLDIPVYICTKCGKILPECIEDYKKDGVDLSEPNIIQ